MSRKVKELRVAKGGSYLGQESVVKSINKELSALKKEGKKLGLTAFMRGIDDGKALKT